jgi:hypothetical protein
LLQAYCAANDTAGNAMAAPVATVLSPPAIMPPQCTAVQRCSDAQPTTRLALSMSVNGTLAYVVVPNAPGTNAPAAPLPPLTPDELRAEAAAPSALAPLLASPPDARHHGIVRVATPFVRVHVPVALVNGTTYTLLLAGEYDGAGVQCCHADALQAVRKFVVDPARCGSVSCCSCASPTLQDVAVAVTAGSAGGAFPASPPLGMETSCDQFTVTQTFALLGARDAAAELAWAVGGAPLRTAPTPGSPELRLQVAPAPRPPVALRAVLQRSEYYDEDPTAVAAADAGRSMHFRCGGMLLRARLNPRPSAHHSPARCSGHAAWATPRPSH